MATDGVRLYRIAAELAVEAPTGNPVVTDVHHDSRAVGPGSLFVAITGASHDGHDFAGDAVDRGAVAVIAERALDVPVPVLRVGDSRAALAVAASIVYEHPSREVSVLGVTGTNGKTTVTHMIHSIVTSAGLTAGLIGTLGARIGGDAVALARTTPESDEIQRLLRRMREAGVAICAMEVSSHALAMRRADCISFRVVGFTNLSQDHLDFHGDMDTYFAEKAGLFSTERARVAVICVDDPWGARLAETTDLRVVTVGSAPGADVAALDLEADRSGTSFTLALEGTTSPIRLPLPGRMNVDNALVAAAMSRLAGVELSAVCSGLENLPPVPGRFEVVSGGWPFMVVVDYAHTPEAVRRVVGEARRITAGRVLVVLGAGGDRDATKRPLMGAAAGQADVVVVTSDNPRSEDPAAIAAAVASGVPAGCTKLVELDRRAAIAAALSQARAEDVILVLGKGHEQGQEFAGGRVVPFDDRVVAAEAWASPGEAGGR